MILLLVPIGCIGMAVFMFFFTRTSEQIPSSLAEFKTELQYQIGGIVGVAQDIGLRGKNKIKLFSQPGKVAIVTGGSRGLGLYVVKKLLDCDMTVIVGVRDTDQARKAVAQVIDSGKQKNVVYEKLDVGSLTSVRAFSKKVQDKFDKVHILVNNAGIMNVPYKKTEDGFESQWAVNYLGHFLLTHLLLPQLKAAGTDESKARVVNVSSCVHVYGTINWTDINFERSSYYPADAYSQSKLAQIMFTRYFDEKMKTEKENVSVFAVHPGVVNTDLFETSGLKYVPWLRSFFFKTPEEGSITVVYAAISPEIEGRGGGYYSNCTRMVAHKMSKNTAALEELYNKSCEMLGIQKMKELHNE